MYEGPELLALREGGGQRSLEGLQGPGQGQTETLGGWNNGEIGESHIGGEAGATGSFQRNA